MRLLLTAILFTFFLISSLVHAAPAPPVNTKEIATVYDEREFKPVWLEEDGFSLQKIEVFQKAIQKQAYLNGLDPADYSFELRGGDLFKNEWRLTEVLMRYIEDLRNGYVQPGAYNLKKMSLPRQTDFMAYVSGAVQADDPENYLAGLAPPHREYEQLRLQLQQYRDIKNEGGWEAVKAEPGTIIYPGDRHEIIPQIRKRMKFMNYDKRLSDVWFDNAALKERDFSDRLSHDADITGISTGNLPADAELIYDKNLAAQIAAFQNFHGRKVDGVIGPETMEALNVPVEDRIDQIIMAMERWRWLPDDLGDKHIRLNIAAYHVRGVENGEDKFVMPIIVGEVAHQTPVFSSVIKNVKMHPDWVAPSSIARRYLIDKIRNNPAVIDRLGYQVQDKMTGEIVPWGRINIEYLHDIDLSQYQFRQRPGVNNALGLVRFSIENDFSIFMHGTPSVHLFEENQRTFSSGCIRVEDPLKMAKFLLTDQEGMPESTVESLYYLGEGEFPETTFINLSKQIPVYVTYATAWVDREGYLHFAEDVYGRDERLRQTLLADREILHIRSE